MYAKAKNNPIGEFREVRNSGAFANPARHLDGAARPLTSRPVPSAFFEASPQKARCCSAAIPSYDTMAAVLTVEQRLTAIEADLATRTAEVRAPVPACPRACMPACI